jgi:hypothetical protein
MSRSELLSTLALAVTQDDNREGGAFSGGKGAGGRKGKGTGKGEGGRSGNKGGNGKSGDRGGKGKSGRKGGKGQGVHTRGQSKGGYNADDGAGFEDQLLRMDIESAEHAGDLTGDSGHPWAQGSFFE